jgi:hypothetical protein
MCMDTNIKKLNANMSGNAGWYLKGKVSKVQRGVLHTDATAPPTAILELSVRMYRTLEEDDLTDVIRTTCNP